jgi:hypothetical protein
VLAAITEYICVNFEAGVQAAAEAHEAPIERFKAVMAFCSRYARERSPEPMLEIEPEFYLTFFRTHFTRHKIAVRQALDPSFDHVERVLGRTMDRMGISEAIIRMQLSTLMVPAEDDWVSLWVGSGTVLEQLLAMVSDQDDRRRPRPGGRRPRTPSIES